MLNLAKRVNHWVWDPNEERKRVERWQQEQERLLQVLWRDGVCKCMVLQLVWREPVPHAELDVVLCTCASCVGSGAVEHELSFSSGTIPERTREAEERVGESTAGGGGGGEETQRRGGNIQTEAVKVKNVISLSVCLVFFHPFLFVIFGCSGETDS